MKSTFVRHRREAREDPGIHFSFTISSYLGGGSRYDGVSSPLLSRCPATSSYDGGGVAADNHEATESESGTYRVFCWESNGGHLPSGPAMAPAERKPDSRWGLWLNAVLSRWSSGCGRVRMLQLLVR